MYGFCWPQLMYVSSSCFFRYTLSLLTHCMYIIVYTQLTFMLLADGVCSIMVNEDLDLEPNTCDKVHLAP